MSSTAGSPALPNAAGRHSVGDASRQACVERQLGRDRCWPHALTALAVAGCRTPLRCARDSKRSGAAPADGAPSSRRLVLPAAGCLGARSGTRFRAGCSQQIAGYWRARANKQTPALVPPAPLRAGRVRGLASLREAPPSGGRFARGRNDDDEELECVLDAHTLESAHRPDAHTTARTGRRTGRTGVAAPFPSRRRTL